MAGPLMYAYRDTGPKWRWKAIPRYTRRFPMESGLSRCFVEQPGPLIQILTKQNYSIYVETTDRLIC